MRRRTTRLEWILLATAIISCTVPVTAAETWYGSANLGVTVRDSHGAAVAGALVTIAYRDIGFGDGPLPRLTDSQGTANFTQLSAGTWSIKVDHADHLSYLATVVARKGKKPQILTEFLEATGLGRKTLRIRMLKGDTTDRGTPVEPVARDAADSPPVLPPPATNPVAAKATATAQPAPPEQASPPDQSIPGVDEISEPAPSPALPEEETATTPVHEIEGSSTPEADVSASLPASSVPPHAETSDALPAALDEPTAETAPEPDPELPVQPHLPAPESEKAEQATATATPVLPQEPAPEAPSHKTTAPQSVALPVAPPSPAPGQTPDVAVPDTAPVPDQTPSEPVLPAPRTDMGPAPSTSAATADATPNKPATPAALQLPPSRRDSLRSYSKRTCFECKPGEWAASSSVEVQPVTAPCAIVQEETARAAMETLVRTHSGRLGGYSGPLPATSDNLPAELRALATGSCRLVAVVLPQGARFTGFRFQASDGSLNEDCLGEQECQIGDARWLFNPGIARADGTTVVYSVFRNDGRTDRTATLTAYFVP